MPALVLITSLPSLIWILTEEAREAREALFLSLQSAGVTLLITMLLGTPLAWILAQHDRLTTRIFSALITVPLLMPPSIIGLTLLEACSRDSILTAFIPMLSRLPFSFYAVVVAQLTVSAPLFILGAAATFRQLDPKLIDVARSLGASPWEAWRRISLPLLAPGLAVSLSLATARSLGEFGATLLFAGHLPGVTQTAPLAIYLELERGTQGALALSLGLIGYALPLLGGLLIIHRKGFSTTSSEFSLLKRYRSRRF